MNSTTELVHLDLSALPKTRYELNTYFAAVKDIALSGSDDIIAIAQKINIMGRIVELFEKDKDIQDYLLSEADKYAKGERSDIQVKEVGVKYDFSECNHPKLQRLEDQKQALEAEIKAIKETLKIKGATEIDADTGEIYQTNKAARSSTTKVIFTLQ